MRKAQLFVIVLFARDPDSWHSLAKIIFHPDNIQFKDAELIKLVFGFFLHCTVFHLILFPFRSLSIPLFSVPFLFLSFPSLPSPFLSVPFLSSPFLSN